MRVSSHMSRRLCAACLAIAALGALTTLAPTAAAQQAASPAPTATPPMVRIRGTLVSADAQKLVVKDRSGETLTLARAAEMPISEVYPIKLEDIKKGSYVGTAAMPQPDGTQKAIEVLVFPEAARGSGEGHRPWDLQPESTMTNATVANLAPAPASVSGGRELKLSYKGGEKTVIVPPDVPIVSFKHADDSLLVPGAKVLITAQDKNRTPTALRVLAGRDGFAPPM
ncbi:MAG: hypothetical protein ABI589_05025 [Burkholderiales bacterium]